MNIKSLAILVPLSVGVIASSLLPLKVSAKADVEVTTSSAIHSVNHTTNQSANSLHQQNSPTRYFAAINQIKRNANGQRLLDMTNDDHFKLVTSRLSKANISASNYPQLYKSLDEHKQQQLAAKTVLNSDTKPQSSKPYEIAKQSGLITHSHMFLNLDVFISDLDGKAYITMATESSVFGGTDATYLDLLIEDADGIQLAPVAQRFEVLEGKKTQAIAKIALSDFKKQHPNLERIYASSWVKTVDANGEHNSGVKLMEYPWDWQAIERRYGEYLNNNGKDSIGFKDRALKDSVVANEYQYLGVHPVDGANPDAPVLDGLVKVCLNRNHADCDYKADQYAQTNQITGVNIPFQGQLTVPHKVLSIYDSTVFANGVDESTNIYMQEGHYGGATKLSYRSMAGQRHFSDYLQFRVDDTDPNNLHTIISWNIPRDAGHFGNALLFSNIAEANLRLTIAVNGLLHFRGRAANFMIQLNSEQIQHTSNNHLEALPKIRLGYSCLARGTYIDMADGTTKAIEDIQIGDLVFGALANNATTRQPMTVVDTSIGIEAQKMFNITTADGKRILMTETHPLATTNKGIVWAKELITGDRLLSDSGSVLIEKINQIQYQDNVFNLKLAPLQGSSLSENQNLGMFANGLLVGDLATQEQYNYKDQFIRQSVAEKLQRMPSKWQTDFISSLQDE